MNGVTVTNLSVDGWLLKCGLRGLLMVGLWQLYRQPSSCSHRSQRLQAHSDTAIGAGVDIDQWLAEPRASDTQTLTTVYIVTIDSCDLSWHPCDQCYVPM